MAIWLSSDTHFGHDKDFIWRPRGFSSVGEMNEAIIANWNSVVDPEDQVYLLGDVIMGTSEQTIKYLDRLNGIKTIICGNHDNALRRSLYAQHGCEVKDAMWLDYCKYTFFLSHYPALTANGDSDKPLKRRVINLCGHVHTPDKFLEMKKGNLSYHVELDSHNNYPVSLDNVLFDINKFMEGEWT